MRHHPVRIASREILPVGKILALFSSTHGYICRKVSVRFVLLLVFPSGLFLLRPRVRSLMKEVGGMLVAVAFARTSLGNAFPCCGQGEVASCASYSVVSQKTGAIHLLVFSPFPAFMNG